MGNGDTYMSIAAPSEGLFKDNGSRFIALAYPVESEEEVKQIVSQLKKEYHDARHHCYAFRLGKDGQKWRASDDGEPSGSAGRPILGQIDSLNLSDILVVVVRYFGGIKLGIPGLIRAYKTSTADALSAASKVEKISGRWIDLDFDYQYLPQVKKLLKDMAVPERNQMFAQDCHLQAFIRDSIMEDFLDRLRKIDTFTQFKVTD